MFKVLVKGCEPTRGTKYSACVDLYASEDVVIGAGEIKLVGLGVCIDLVDMMPIIFNEFDWCTGGEQDSLTWFTKRHYLQLMLRSSLGKKGLILPNGVGIIDLDYEDEIKMIIHNPINPFEINRKIMNVSGNFEKHIESDIVFHIKKGDKIAQITLLEHKSYLLGYETDKERDGGFGSTDKGNENV